MDKEQIKQILELNKKFYELVANEFSPTRKNAWPGWNISLKTIEKHFRKTPSLNVLDLGCGNGRFYDFLKKNFDKYVEYLGIDTNKSFLNEAQSKYPDGSFLNLDVFSDNFVNKIIYKQYELITAFGIAHHIPDKKYRKDWFKDIKSLLSNDGLFVCTFWNFTSDTRFITRSEKADFLEENDYLYDWGKDGPKRYVHNYTDIEIQDITNYAGLKKTNEFYSDGKTNDLNRYIIFRKENQ